MNLKPPAFVVVTASALWIVAKALAGGALVLWLAALAFDLVLGV